VPLSIQALAISKELHAVTGRSRYVFPKLGDTPKTMSENTIDDALNKSRLPFATACGVVTIVSPPQLKSVQCSSAPDRVGRPFGTALAATRR
jgi:hypothetical protein